MTDEQFEIIRGMLAEILRRLERPDEQVTPEPMRATDLVDVDYVCRVTGLARVTVMQGKAGVREIPLQSTRPKRWLKADVDRWQRARAARLMPAKQKALRVLERRRA